MSPVHHPALHTRRIARLFVTWLLAIVLPLQGSAAVVFGAMGPAHSHRGASALAVAPAPVLQDVRRWKPSVQRDEHVFAALGHFHAGRTVQRHQHARDDGSVVAANAGDVADTDEGAGALAVSLLAPLPAVGAWLPPATASANASRPLWAALTGFVPRMDRPPRPQG